MGPLTEQRKNGAIPEKSEPAAGQPIPLQRQEAGGRGKGQTRPQRRHPHQMANRLPVSNQRLPEILDGQHPPGGSHPEISAPEGTQGAPDRCAWKLRLGLRRREGTPHRGRVHLSSSWLPELLGQGRHKTQAQPSLRFCGVPENWSHTQCRASSI